MNTSLIHDEIKDHDLDMQKAPDEVASDEGARIEQGEKAKECLDTLFKMFVTQEKEIQANANENEHKQTLKAEDIMQCFPAEWPSDLREAFRKEATASTQPAKPILEKWSALPTAKPAKAKATKLRANGWAEQVDTD